MDIAARHKDVKQEAYWHDLVHGTNGTYKERMIETLLSTYYKGTGKKIMDVGCGTCDVILKYQKKYQSEVATCTDYDSKIIAQMKEKYAYPGVEWVVADIFDFSSIKHQYDLIFLLDMLHEIYSFYGRPERQMDIPIDHARGQRYTVEALKSLSQKVNPKGGIVITDNVLCEENKSIVIKLKSPKIVDTIRYFLTEYPSKNIPHTFLSSDELQMSSRDFCILLTQYNKIKQQNWARWNVEKMEIHQYFTLREYQDIFLELGYDVHEIVGTPKENRDEYEEDFEVLTKGFQIPEKRITLLALKKS